MKKNKKWLLTATGVVILVVLLFFVLPKMRENRVWPFNSSLSRILPPEIKKLAYNLTTPRGGKMATSFLYNINVAYHNIPDPGAVGGGGAINNLGEGRFFVTLNSGQSLIFDLPTRNFSSVDSTHIKGIFSSVRDVLALEHGGKKYLAFLGATDQLNGCKRISLYLNQYSISGLKLLLDVPVRLWESELACNSPMDNNAGGRIAYQENKFYLSVGFFMGSLNIEDTLDYAQRNDSSFGKILEIDWDGRSQVFSSGHRNPQGLFFAKSGKILFSTEHSSRGGDELNIIKRQGNYGFPCETYGTNYSYEFSRPQSEAKSIRQEAICVQKKFIDPNFYWANSTGISQGIEYMGEEFHALNGNLLVGSLAGLSLFRIQLGDMNNVMFLERINIGERLRDINISDDGKILLLTDGGDVLVLTVAK